MANKKASAAPVAEKKDIPAEFTGIWIPAALYRFTHLDPYDREILGCINGFNHGGKKFISVSYLSRLMNIDRSKLSKRVKKLQEDGFLKVADYNSKRGSCNALVLTDKARGMDLNDYEDELEPPNDKGSSGGCGREPHPVAESHTPVAESHTNNKLYKSSSSKRDAVAKTEPFDFDKAFEFVLDSLNDEFTLEDLPKGMINAIWRDYKNGATSPSYSRALTFMITGIEQHLATERRSMAVSYSRDELAAARSRHINAQTALAERKTSEIEPRDRFDTSWAEGLEILEQAE